jgi:hypothetical protein
MDDDINDSKLNDQNNLSQIVDPLQSLFDDLIYDDDFVVVREEVISKQAYDNDFEVDFTSDLDLKFMLAQQNVSSGRSQDEDSGKGIVSQAQIAVAAETHLPKHDSNRIDEDNVLDAFTEDASTRKSSPITENIGTILKSLDSGQGHNSNLPMFQSEHIQIDSNFVSSVRRDIKTNRSRSAGTCTDRYQ